MNLTLNGKSNYNEHNLLGKSKYGSQPPKTLNEIKKIKIRILNNYLIPLYKKQWKKLYENLFFLPKIKEKINVYKDFSNFEDLQLYIDLIQLLEIVIEKEKLLEKQNNNMKMRFSSTTEINSPQAMSMMVQLTSIRLLPEYELYHSLFGKPKKETKETYEQNKINTIKKLLERENMDYQQMKNYFEEKEKSI
jgi:hypothetical protein